MQQNYFTSFADGKVKVKILPAGFADHGAFLSARHRFHAVLNDDSLAH
ncbi:MAG: hypothetical protein IJ214_09610 [Clostridia bacterium]|nr:hypothetical protein [Clostridia bacterium]